ncbi:MAG: phospholipid carrier-dependent glycosyltransferase [Oscillochloris sp.]|nr:phospholipid carrier-dependent glycosyltransferase [Oscillochloris sp.]
MNFEMLFTLALLFNSDVAAQLLTLVFLGLIMLGLLLAGRRFFDDRIGALAAAIFCIIPITKRVGGAGLIDPAMGLFTIGAAISFERWRRERKIAWLILCGAFCGMSAGSKLMGGGIAILFGLLVLWEELRRWWAAGARRPSSGVLLNNLVRSGLLIGLAGTVLVAPWYLRSYINTGNPVWPFAFHIFGARDWDELGDEYNHQLMYEVWATELPRSPLGLGQLFGIMLSDPEQLGGYRGGVGNILPLGGLLVLLLIRWAPSMVRHNLFVGGGFFLLWFVFVSHQLRFLLPVTPVMALAVAWAAVWLLDRLRSPALQGPLVAALVLVLLLEWPWGMRGERALFVSKLPYLSGAQSRAAFLDEYIDVMPLFRYANAELPSDARLLLLPWETRGYYLNRGYIWGNPGSQRIIPFEQYTTAEALRERLRELEITHILENSAFLYTGLRYWDRDRALMLELADRCGDTLIRLDDAALIELRDQCRRRRVVAVDARIACELHVQHCGGAKVIFQGGLALPATFLYPTS